MIEVIGYHPVPLFLQLRHLHLTRHQLPDLYLTSHTRQNKFTPKVVNSKFAETVESQHLTPVIPKI